MRLKNLENRDIKRIKGNKGQSGKSGLSLQKCMDNIVVWNPIKVPMRAENIYQEIDLVREKM